MLTMPASGKRLVVTSDDFGLSAQVNAAVERAHRDGILTAASLMVSAPAEPRTVTAVAPPPLMLIVSPVTHRESSEAR